MSEARTVAEIEAEIQRTRLALQSTVDEITHRVDPREQVAEMKERAKNYTSVVKEQVLDTVERAKGGSAKDIGILAGVAIVAVLGIAALVKR
ncbi:DUF3618 domain-containing protein [Gleimia sp. 6138-11-ORH1]|uniref:DUF3618 domain-containing protein n=1 Tax=Gleimia sp. 6138-11-ORH1 TaxID=2973937 RepID=UPI0021697329|nr:DUF3618 domain-containing protein [Gleimia sp. 6138-11-ORH1]MCS4484698.1 DUF3618 domain-containing protein [Gleimia sp. 6138-11-ORH1]